MNTRKVLYANDGKILTDGKIFGRRIYLAENVSSDAFYEITEEEYSQMPEENAAEQMINASQEEGDIA